LLSVTNTQADQQKTKKSFIGSLQDGNKDFKFSIIEIHYKNTVLKFFYECNQKSVIQSALVICGPFIYGFAYPHWQNWSKLTSYSQKWPSCMQIQDSRSKMKERIYRK